MYVSINRTVPLQQKCYKKRLPPHFSYWPSQGTRHPKILCSWLGLMLSEPAGKDNAWKHTGYAKTLIHDWALAFLIPGEIQVLMKWQRLQASLWVLERIHLQEHNCWLLLPLQRHRGQHGQIPLQCTNSMVPNLPVLKYLNYQISPSVDLKCVVFKMVHKIHLEIVSDRGGICEESVFRCWTQTQHRAASYEQWPDVQCAFSWRRNLWHAVVF